MAAVPSLRAALLVLLWSAALLASAQPGANEALPRPVAAALAAANVPASSVAVWAQELDSARPRVAHNADKPLNPASLMKLLTAFAALELLGPTYIWKTEAWAAGALQGETLEGDLVLRGSGDPKLTVEQFWLLLRALRARGLREIRGDLVLDRGAFEALDQDAARFDSEPLRPYNVAPDALLLNFKSFRFTFVPDAEARAAHVAVEPRSAALEFTPSVRLADGPCNDWRAQLRATFHDSGTAARASFSGAYPASCAERSWSVAMQTHTAYVHGVFRQLWTEAGGGLRGGVREGKVPAGSRLLFTHESPGLAELVRDMNKHSNNVMARQIFLTLSAEILKRPARPERSAQVVRAWLEQRGLAFPELVIENGSGLSRVERISAGNLGRLLLAGYASAVMPELIASLPLVAYDGTMRRRLRYGSIAGQAHIKTGSLADVRSLAGYVLDARGRRVALVFIANHPNAGATQRAQDALLEWAYEGRNP